MTKKLSTLDPSMLGISRREMLGRFGAGFGTLGLQQMLSQQASATTDAASPLAPKAPHFAPRAKRPRAVFGPGTAMERPQKGSFSEGLRSAGYPREMRASLVAIT